MIDVVPYTVEIIGAVTGETLWAVSVCQPMPRVPVPRPAELDCDWAMLRVTFADGTTAETELISRVPCDAAGGGPGCPSPS